MGRWKPDARGRLERAAMDLYSERGFEQTTVAEIAERAGLAERTFFRYYADKREVLFGGTGELRDLLIGTVAGAPASATPVEAIASGLDAAASILEERRDFACRRQALIAGHPSLRERELIKLASWAQALAEVLRERGVEPPAASLLAEIAIAVFRVGFERWIDDANDRPLAELLHETLEEARAVSAA